MYDDIIMERSKFSFLFLKMIVFKLDNSELLPPSGLVDFVETRLEIDGRRCRITLDRVLSLEILGLPSRGVVGSLLSGLLNSNTCGFRMSE